MLQAAVVALALLYLYRESLLGYLGDQHYQEHFVYLWGFLFLALAFLAWRFGVSKYTSTGS